MPLTPEHQLEIFHRLQRANAAGEELIFFFRDNHFFGSLQDLKSPGLLKDMILVGTAGERVVAVQRPEPPYDWAVAARGLKASAEITAEDRMLHAELYGEMMSHLGGGEQEPYIRDNVAAQARRLPGIAVALHTHNGKFDAPLTFSRCGKYQLLAVENPQRPGHWLTANPRITAAWFQDAAMPTRAERFRPALATEAPTPSEGLQFRQRRDGITVALLSQSAAMQEDGLLTGPGHTDPGAADRKRIAADWMRTDFGTEQIKLWVTTGCFEPESALALERAGITAREAGAKVMVPGGKNLSLGRAFARRLLPLDLVTQLVWSGREAAKQVEDGQPFQIPASSHPVQAVFMGCKGGDCRLVATFVSTEEVPDPLPHAVTYLMGLPRKKGAELIVRGFDDLCSVPTMLALPANEQNATVQDYLSPTQETGHHAATL